MRKSILVSVLISFVLVVLAACGGGSDNASKGDGQKITIFQDKVEISDQLVRLAQEYTEETGVEVEVVGTTGSDYFQQLQIRLNSNQGPSIFSIAGPAELQRIQQSVYDMSNEPYVQHIMDGLALEMDGKIYGMPYGIEGYGLVYNKDLVNPEDIYDYDSFVEVLKSFEGTGVNGISLSNSSYFLIGHLSNYPFSLQPDNAGYIEQLTNGEVTMSETPEFQELGRFFEAIRAYSPNPLEINYDRQIGDFATGKTAMIHQGNWAIPMFADYELEFEMGMMPLPFMGGDALAVDVPINWAINAQKGEEEIKAASDFLEWLYSSETGHRYILDEFEFVPAVTNIEVSSLDPLSKAVYDAADSGKTIPWSFNYYPASSVRGNLLPPTEKFFLDPNMTGEDLIKELDANWPR